MRFEWDPAKDKTNRAKHGLSFEKATGLFKTSASKNSQAESMSDEIRELTDRDLARAMPRKQRERILRGQLAGGKDVAALRRFVGLTQHRFADALGISVHTLRNWEQGRRSPAGPAMALLRIAARHPRVLRENLAAAV